MADVALYVVIGTLGLYITYRIFRSWRAFRADDIVVINGEAFSLDMMFEKVGEALALEGKIKSLIRYSFLRSRRQIATFQTQQNMPLEAVVAFFMAGSALGYAENMHQSGHQHEHDAFIQIAEQAKAYGEQLAPGQYVEWK